ncbi:hypothetical protein GGR54DRAFT_450954 [Hypoxylon sp. NC1633]|nr:hypothetical protein GGR54DRAFT_450954 [Hypoxylon sp. NC1633]
MSAPYWGQLPPSKARRMSGDYDQTHRRQSSDQSQSRSNRASVQTTQTDAHTDSTFSPLASPAATNFQGLAPRPPSLPYGQNRYPPELQERRRRRPSISQGDDTHEETPTSPPPPPAAPDVPRAPPVSYKDPYRNGSPAYAPTYSYSADGQPGPPLSAYRNSPQARVTAMESDSFYKDGTPPAEKQFRAPVLDRSRQNFDENGAGAKQLGADTERSGSLRRPANGDAPEKGYTDPSLPKRQGTFTAPPKRPTWADDRSPLQKLELTLDSITKEEKRARVEAAERRARERATRRESSVNQEKLQPQPERATSQQVRFKDGRQPEDRHDDSRAIAADIMQAQPSAAVHQGPLSQNPIDEARQYKISDQSPNSRIPVAKNRNIAADEKADVPQRNLSFRERAAKTDASAPKDTEDNSPGSSASPVSPITPPGGGFALRRNGSNKLKKNPPGDPWYSARKEAEERAAAYYRRNSQAQGINEPPRNADSTSNAQPQNEIVKEMPPSPPEHYDGRPPARGKQFDQEEDYDEPPVRRKGFAAAIGLGRGESMESSQRSPPTQHTYQSSMRNTDAPKAPGGNTVKSVKFPEGSDYDSDEGDHHGLHDYMHRGKLKPGRGMYQRPQYLDEWQKATTGTLSGASLDLSEEPAPGADKSTTWWENSGKRRGSTTTRVQPTDAYNSAREDAQVPTRFRPSLYLKCGPLLRYCGIRYEEPLTRVNRNDALPDLEIWRGSVMIVTQDSESSYDIPPILRLFLQPIELLPPPPAELRGELPPEYVDPIAGIPKLGRRGETLYVRPVEHLEEGKDVSRLEPDDGLFEITRSAPDFNNAPDPPGSFTSRKRRTQVDGEKLGKYKDVRGFRLHAERGHTFWRFNIEVELRDKQQRIAYRINHGPATGFWVPARGQSMNIMFHSCNGFSLSAKPDEFSGPDPMWRDVLNNHQTRPFHVMIGGGDQVYNDAVMRDTHHFQNWLHIKNPLHKNNAPFTPEMQDEMEHFYLERYMMWFSQGLFGLANCQIPMVNMYDDHDIIDGFGSYPHHFMKSPVFTGLGNVAFKYYMLFQHQSVPEETEQSEPSWIMGVKPGPYIHERSRSLCMSLGTKIALLAVDCRTERTRDEVLREETWDKLMKRCDDEIIKGETEHLLVLLGVPIAYPRLVWLENILTSRLMDPIKALGKAGLLGNFLNRFDGGVEVLDDLDDHWTAKNHKDERRFIIQDLQDFACDKSVRITILSGDVHLAAVGQFYSNPKENLAKHKDFRYIPNIISSAIANTPPPDIMADILNKRNKVHHLDKETDEDMIPIFTNGVDGKPRNNKRLLPHRNWCSIREYAPGQTPPPTPPPEEYDITPEGTPPGSRGGSLLRRFSLSKARGPTVRPDVPADRSRPPISGSSFLRSFSFSRRASSGGNGNGNGNGKTRPNKLTRTLSLDHGEPARPRRSLSLNLNLFGGGRKRGPSTDRPDDGGINGDWGPDSGDEDEGAAYDTRAPPPHNAHALASPRARPTGFAPGYGMGSLRGGAGPGRNDEYEVGDDSFFMARPPRRAVTQPVAASSYGAEKDGYGYDDKYDDEYYHGRNGNGNAHANVEARDPPVRGPFHRTPTGLTARQLKEIEKAGGPEQFEVNLEGGLDVCLNVEVNPKDPAGITVPYRLLVPRLWSEYKGEDGSVDGDGGAVQGPGRRDERDVEYDDEEEPDERMEWDDGEKMRYEGDAYGYGGKGRDQVPVAPQPQPQPQGMVYEDEEKQPGILKRLFSGRGRGRGNSVGGGGGGGGGGGSQFRARRQSP